jgi:glutamate synthase domain-containing protein 2
MNRIGAKSVSGEGGEDSARYKPLPNGDNPNSPSSRSPRAGSASPPNI